MIIRIRTHNTFVESEAEYGYGWLRVWTEIFQRKFQDVHDIVISLYYCENA